MCWPNIWTCNFLVAENITADYLEETKWPVFEFEGIVDRFWYVTDKEVGQAADIVG